MIEPGATIGIIGGGQLGRMLSIAAARLGYRTHIYDPHEASCADDVAAYRTRAAFESVEAMTRFGESVDVATYEFENLPSASLQALGDKLRPGVRSLEIAQDRAKEKEFIEQCHARVAPWRAVSSLEELEAAVRELNFPLVLKTRRYGYDGKGQAWIRSEEEIAIAWAGIGEEPAIAERGVAFAAEFSVILTRWADGRASVWHSAENLHREGILRRSTVPCGHIVGPQVAEARNAAQKIANVLDHVGVLTVEFFASREGPVVNEIAPRVHNSGHWTIEGAVTSQFEQHIRAICGLPPGSTDLTARGAVMDNLIGPDVERWAELVADPQLHVHIYGKGEARPGRKMGHTTRVTR
jgi:5-(carboxyamino)imidazole ribonucleotide synthase